MLGVFRRCGRCLGRVSRHDPLCESCQATAGTEIEARHRARFDELILEIAEERPPASAVAASPVTALAAPPAAEASDRLTTTDQRPAGRLWTTGREAAQTPMARGSDVVGLRARPV